jgi:hypothetical protein
VSALAPFTVETRSILLSAQDPEQRELNERLLLAVTGCTPDQIKAYARKKNGRGQRLRLRRVGRGRGTRFILYISDWNEYLEGMPCD